MYTISSDILNRFQSGQKQYARLTFSNNSTIENDRIIQGTFSINRYVVTGESIGIGSTVAAELSFVLRNGDAAYTSDDFLDEEVFAEIGVMDSNDTIQYVPFGYYTFDDASESATTINLSALDRMLKFEKTVGTITFPITVNNLLAAACTACSVTLDSSVTGLVNGTYSVTELPDSVKTWREVLQWICEITGTNAWITRDGKLKLSWFATSSSATLTTANRLNSSVGKDVISITGVTILANNVKYTAGTNTRPLTITDNGLISHDHQTVADAINTARNGYSYSSFTATAMPLPQLDPMDVITFVKGASNILCPVTDITFKLSGMTTLGCKSDQLAHGRSYGLQDATFYAHNIAANAVTADKISVDDLAALRATIAGWNIGTEALYKEVTSGGYTYRVELCAPASITPNTQCITVKRKATGSSTWEIIDTTTYGGQHTAKDFIANGRVQIAPDYDLQEAGVYAVDLEQNGAELYANPNFLNIEEGGSQTHLDATVVSSTAADDTMLRMENYGADYAEFRATQGDYGTRDYKEAALSPKEVRVKSNSYSGNPEWEAKMTSDKVSVSTADGTLHTDMEYNGIAADSGDYRASVSASSAGGFLEVVDQNSGKSSMLSLSELTVNDHDLLRLTPHFAQMFATAIPANADLNTTTYLKVGQYCCFTSAAAATLSNCPTDFAFCMTVLVPFSSAYDNETTTTWQYRVRKIVCYNGEEYVQAANSNGSGVWTYNAWRKVVDVGTNEYKRIVPHLYAGYATVVPSGANLNSQAYMKIGEYSLTTAVAQSCSSYLPYATEGRLTVYTPSGTTYDDESGTWKYRIREYETWDGRKWRQLCQVNGTAGSWTYGAWQFVFGSINGTLTPATGYALDESFCKQVGQTVNIRVWISGLATNAQTHSNAIKVTGVALPSTPIRFVFTCWLNNGIAAYAGYGSMDTYGNITLVKAVTNSNKASFEFTYVV